MSKDEDVQVREFTETHWFRVTVQTYGYTNEYGDVCGSYDRVHVDELKVEKHTPKGAFLQTGFGARKFVRRDYVHRGRAFAAPTLEQAKEDFVKRKAFQIGCLQDKINRAERQITAVKGYTK